MQRLRKLLLPLSWVYGAILRLRHRLYDKGLLHSYKPEQRTVVVGNLGLGGTGKTPMVDYLIDLLGTENIAVLSRGYGRKTKGNLIVKSESSAEDCGDEPLLLKKRHYDLLVMVDEKRARGLRILKEKHPSIKMVILDDAMQHRQIQADFYLLLTTYQAPFVSDDLLPAGTLRDIKSRSSVANAIVVTKVPENASIEDREKLRRKLSKKGQKTFFSSISYGDICTLDDSITELAPSTKVVLLSGIAGADQFESEARKAFEVIKHFKFRDHHVFTRTELVKLRNFIDTFEPENPVILTTEKDAQRLRTYGSLLSEILPETYFWKIRTDFGAESDDFNAMIRAI